MIEGYIRDSSGQQPLVGVSLEAFQRNPLGDLNLTAFHQSKYNDGFYEVIPQMNIILAKHAQMCTSLLETN